MAKISIFVWGPSERAFWGFSNAVWPSSTPKIRRVSHTFGYNWRTLSGSKESPILLESGLIFLRFPQIGPHQKSYMLNTLNVCSSPDILNCLNFSFAFQCTKHTAKQIWIALTSRSDNNITLTYTRRKVKLALLTNLLFFFLFPLYLPKFGI